MPTVNRKKIDWGRPEEKKKTSWTENPILIKFYNSAAWRKFSKLYKQKNKYCVECQKEKILTLAKFTDHKDPLTVNPSGNIVAGKYGPYDEENLQGLCPSHNASKTSKQRGK